MAIIPTMLLQIVSTEITEKQVQREQDREREHFVWENVIAIYYDKNKKIKEQEKSLLNPLSGLNPSAVTSY